MKELEKLKSFIKRNYKHVGKDFSLKEIWGKCRMMMNVVKNDNIFKILLIYDNPRSATWKYHADEGLFAEFKLSYEEFEKLMKYLKKNFNFYIVEDDENEFEIIFTK